MLISPPRCPPPSPQRYRSGFQRLYHFTDLVLVECPRCKQRAEVRATWGMGSGRQHALYCPNCHLVKCGLDTLVIARVQQFCPDCGRQLNVTVSRVNDAARPLKVRCPQCGHTNTYQPRTEATPFSVFDPYKRRGVPLDRARRVFGEFEANSRALSDQQYLARDPFYNLPLWLQAPLGRHLLWAYNHEHLRVLKAYIGAELRERPLEGGVMSMVNRLPPFMQSAKNRAQLLALIDRLARK